MLALVRVDEGDGVVDQCLAGDPVGDGGQGGDGVVAVDAADDRVGGGRVSEGQQGEAGVVGEPLAVGGVAHHVRLGAGQGGLGVTGADEHLVPELDELGRARGRRHLCRELRSSWGYLSVLLRSDGIHSRAASGQ
ncbi:hypothetical protein ACWDUC_22325 [Streptomyces tricolor]